MRTFKEYMSNSGFTPNKIDHQSYKPQHFDRYPFKPDENKTKEYLEKMKKSLLNEVLIGTEALAGYYGNDAIVKALDDYLSELGKIGIKIV